MIGLLGAGAWIGLGLLLGVAIGRTIRQGDERELPDCCPHIESEAPETVRGEFRAVIVR